MALALEIFIPAYNEAQDLEVNLERLLAYCRSELSAPYRLTVVDNGSTDATPALAERLARQHEEVGALHFPEMGRGRALRRAFLGSPADRLGYMDADLSTHLRALPEALERLARGADLVVGSRLVRGSRIRRQWRREILSRAYNRLVRGVFETSVRDHQCGFKFLSREACQAIVPSTLDPLWFFDTELLVLAQRAGLAIEELPVEWIEDLGSTVHVLRTVRDDLVAMWRLRQRLRALEAGLPPGLKGR